MNSLLSYFFPEKLENYKLELVQILFRHGKRTPITKLHFMDEEEPLNLEFGYQVPEWNNGAEMLLTFPNVDENNQFSLYQKIYESNKQYLKGSVNSGMLTKQGVQQLHDIGKNLRENYIEKTKFLSSNFDPKELYVRSTDFDRTLQSAMSLLNGLYPLNTRNGKFIHILTRDRKTENIYPSYSNCKKLTQVGKANKSHSSYKEFLQKHHKEIEMFKNLLKTKYTPESWHNTLQCHILNEIPLPHYISQEFINLMEMRANEEVSYVFTKEASVLGMGRFLNEIVNNFKRKTMKVDERKLYLYSGHDTSIIPLLTSLDIFDGRFPPVGTTLIFELYSDKSNNYYLRINYRDKDLKIPSLNYKEVEGKLFVPFNEFLNFTKDLTISDQDYLKKCLSDENEISE